MEDGVPLESHVERPPLCFPNAPPEPRVRSDGNCFPSAGDWRQFGNLQFGRWNPVAAAAGDAPFPSGQHTGTGPEPEFLNGRIDRRNVLSGFRRLPAEKQVVRWLCYL